MSNMRNVLKRNLWGKRTMLITVLLFAGARAASARTKTDPLCKEIRAAIAANQTLEQITAEFDTDAEHVMRCTQQRSQRRTPHKAKAPRPAKAKPARSKASGSTP